jgi:hypothetical protein
MGYEIHKASTVQRLGQFEIHPINRHNKRKERIMDIRKIAVLTVAALVVIGTMTYVVSANGLPAPQAEKGFIVGEVIDLVNYGMFGRSGEEHREAGLFRAEAGFPVGILQADTGKVFVAVYRVPVPAAGMQTANHVLAPYMGQKVTVQGLLYRSTELNMIRISVITEY